MAIEIKMPALSPTMTTGTVAKWLVAEGDTVKAGDIIAEIETDKATMEVESVDEGVLAKIVVAAGSENVEVGRIIALLAEDGEALDAVAGLSPAPAVVEVAAPTVPAAPAAAPAVPAAAATPPPVTAPVSTVTQDAGARVFASPLARRIAAERGIVLDGVRGSGPHGRILRRDIEAANPVPAAPAIADTVGAPPVQPAVRGDSYLVANSQMRKVIAARLQESKQQAPHFYLTVDCIIDRLLEARTALNDKAPQGVKISVNDMIIRAAAMALMAVPEANASWEGEHTRRFRNADISMAVAVDGGLITPVIWAAEQKGLAALSQITSGLAKKARDGALAPEEYAGGSFTISNLGMFGVREFGAVINPPQGGILAVGAGEQRPVVIDGKLDIATVMTVTLSADHRAVDGAVGAQWLQAFKGFVENPVTMLL
jgi:pyruvate dehydrogenase E2 component (dihydrolipoamide acetyltransferase)